MCDWAVEYSLQTVGCDRQFITEIYCAVLNYTVLKIWHGRGRFNGRFTKGTGGVSVTLIDETVKATGRNGEETEVTER
jgi:hypothetical protein